MVGVEGGEESGDESISGPHIAVALSFGPEVDIWLLVGVNVDGWLLLALVCSDEARISDKFFVLVGSESDVECCWSGEEALGEGEGLSLYVRDEWAEVWTAIAVIERAIVASYNGVMAKR